MCPFAFVVAEGIRIAHDPLSISHPPADAINDLHVSGKLHNAISEDPARYLHDNPKLLEYLRILRRGGKKVFLLTNRSAASLLIRQTTTTDYSLCVCVLFFVACCCQSIWAFFGPSNGDFLIPLKRICSPFSQCWLWPESCVAFPSF